MKKLLSFSLAFALFFALCVPALAAPTTFGDVAADAWYYIPVDKAAELGLISGYDKAHFGPNDKVTYAQYATMLSRILWSDEVESYASICQGQPWYMSYVLICEDHGVFNNTIFADCPDWSQTSQPITREAMAQMSYNFLEAADVDMSMTQAEELLGVARIKDYGTIDAGNKQAVVWCYVNGVLNGYSGGNFGPKDNLTRAQAATVLCQVYGRATGDVTGTGKPVVKPSATRPADAIGGQYDVSRYNVPADSNKDGWITEAEVQAVVAQLKTEYPEGSLWRGPDGNDETGKYFGHAGRGTGCAGFTYMVSDRIFGNLPKRQIDSAYDLRLWDITGSSSHWALYTGPNPDNNQQTTTADTGANQPIVWMSLNLPFGDFQNAVTARLLTIYTRYPVE